MKERKIAAAYMREHVGSIVFYGTVAGIFLVIAGLYGYGNAVRHISYAAVLIAFFGLLYGAWEYAGYRKRCRELWRLSEKEAERGGFFPAGRSLPERLYQHMVRREEEEKRQILSEYDAKLQDMADYYTLWTHQIKTPIAAMRLLLHEERQPLEELFKIEQYAEMALHYARLGSPSSDLLFQTENIHGIISRAVRKYSILFIGSGLSFAMEEFSCRGVTDAKWLGFAAEQILSNALKYTPCGGIRIYGLDGRGRETAEEAVYTVIEDTGIGIRREDLPRIFEKGFTGYNGRLDRKSTGIGLYLCRQIMDRLGHTITVESEEGKGTRVVLGFWQDGM